jgi:hypothetical protein
MCSVGRPKAYNHPVTVKLASEYNEERRKDIVTEYSNERGDRASRSKSERATEGDNGDLDRVSDARVNLLILERVMGARRQLLPKDRCGLVLNEAVYDCFGGHDRFDDERVWETCYAGPDFCQDLAWAFAAEAATDAAGMRGIYLERLLTRVYPNWQNALEADDVLAFWFALAHASAGDRARALAAASAAAISLRSGADKNRRAAEVDGFAELRSDAGRLIELVSRVPSAAGSVVVSLDPAAIDHQTETTARLAIASVRQFVLGLRPDAAERLMAAYLFGTAEDRTFAGWLAEVRRYYPQQARIADKLSDIGVAVLTEALKIGMEKLVQERDHF